MTMKMTPMMMMMTIENNDESQHTANVVEDWGTKSKIFRNLARLLGFFDAHSWGYQMCCGGKSENWCHWAWRCETQSLR